MSFATAAVLLTQASICWNPDKICRGYWIHFTRFQLETVVQLGFGSDLFDRCPDVTPICSAVMGLASSEGVKVGVLAMVMKPGVSIKTITDSRSRSRNVDRTGAKCCCDWGLYWTVCGDIRLISKESNAIYKHAC